LGRNADFIKEGRMLGDDLARFYCKKLHKHFVIYYAAWPIASDAKLGDVGVLHDRLYFQRLSDLGKFDIGFEIREDPKAGTFEYQYASSIEMHASGSGAVPAADTEALVELTFSRRGAIAFGAGGARFEHIDDQLALARVLEERYRAGQWQRQHVVVIGRLLAGSMTAFVSESAGASVRLKAMGQVDPTHMASLTANVRAEKVDRIGHRVVAEKEMVPLIALGGIRRRFFGGGGFGTRSVVPDAPNDSGEHGAMATEDDEVFFGQLALGMT
jgi:hypothetical protein